MLCHKKNREKLIYDYLTGSLSEEEKSTFIEHYFNCDTCFDEIRVKREVIQLCHDNGDILFEEFLEKQGANKVITHINPVSKKRWILAFAAILITVFSFAIHKIWLTSPSVESLELEPYPYIKPSTLFEKNRALELFFKGMDHYQNQEYDLASRKLETTLKIDPQLKEAHFYLGICFLMQDKVDKAINNLIIAAETNPESEKEHWYLGQAHLKRGERQKAIHELQKVAALGQRRYAQKARELIEKLRLTP
jgi:tetratricopeptide (TPR) repeat protein